jgi:hypothetical protein
LITGVPAFVGTFFGTLAGRKTAVDQDVFKRREETMRLFRWAAELVTYKHDTDPTLGEGKRNLGLRTLGELRNSDLLQDSDRPLIDAVLTVLTDWNLEGYDEAVAPGETDINFVVAGED